MKYEILVRVVEELGDYLFESFNPELYMVYVILSAKLDRYCED